MIKSLLALPLLLSSVVGAYTPSVDDTYFVDINNAYVSLINYDDSSVLSSRIESFLTYTNRADSLSLLFNFVRDPIVDSEARITLSFMKREYSLNNVLFQFNIDFIDTGTSMPVIELSQLSYIDYDSTTSNRYFVNATCSLYDHYHDFVGYSSLTSRYLFKNSSAIDFDTSYENNNVYQDDSFYLSLNLFCLSADVFADNVSDGWDVGYGVGYQDGLNDASQQPMTLFLTIADTPLLMIRSLFNFTFFGINFFYIIVGLVTLFFIILIIKKFIK